MKPVKITRLVFAAILSGFIFFGCGSAPEPVVEEPPPPPAPERPVYPLRPIDVNIVEQVLESGDSLKKLQYYISEPVTLMKESLRQNVEIRQGAGLRREMSATGQIVIRKETAGILVNTFYGPDRRRVLAVSFDAANDKDALFFLWNAEEERFTLDYDTESGLVNYGDQKYLVTFPGDMPHLLIRFSEERTDNPSERVIRGRFIPQEN